MSVIASLRVLMPIAGFLGLLAFAAPAVATSVMPIAGDAAAVLTTATGEYPFTVEVVDTDESRAKGLMFRTELAPDAGMLFDFGAERPTAFWMENTLIPLDMIFIAADGVVRKVHANAIPHDRTSIPSGVPVRFVLEIPGGRAAEIGLKVGDKLRHMRVPR